MSDDDIEKLKDFAKEEKIVAIGEIGLTIIMIFTEGAAEALVCKADKPGERT